MRQTPPESGASIHTARGITTTALLGAIAAILIFLNFPLPIFPAFIKMDVSDAPALIAAFAMGPAAGVAVELIKNAVNLTHTSTGGVGELANFSIGAAFVVPAGLLYKRRKDIRRAVTALIVGTLTMTVVAAFANYFVLIPLYSNFVPMETIVGMYRAIIPYADTLPKIILMSVVPFNLLKGLIVSLVTFALYKKLSPVIKGL
ncbi:ECF transporter S component [Synergistaceae bacterium OttesenSCG-928-I11]|nr:ECF transporter S component [Synergistaceae bacterium OttesenSCG-928-I11]